MRRMAAHQQLLQQPRQLRLHLSVAAAQRTAAQPCPLLLQCCSLHHSQLPCHLHLPRTCEPPTPAARPRLELLGCAAEAVLAAAGQAHYHCCLQRREKCLLVQREAAPAPVHEALHLLRLALWTQPKTTTRWAANCWCYRVQALRQRLLASARPTLQRRYLQGLQPHSQR